MGKRTYGDQNGVSKPEPKQKKERFNDVKFINRDLSSAERESCKAWEYTPEQAFDDINALSEEYRITFKYDDFGRCSGCWVQPIDKEHEDAGYILCGRGSSSFKAFKQAVFVWRIIGGGATWKQFDSGRSYDLDD